jgi:hypothetical protein
MGAKIQHINKTLLPRAHWIYYIILFVVGYLYHRNMGHIQLFSADADSYISFHTTRTIGYPAFLWLINKLTGGYGAVAVIQLLLFLGGLGFLALRLAAFLESFFAGLFLILGVMALPEIVNYTGQIFTESLMMTLSFFLVGFTLNQLKTPHWRTLLSIGFLLGLLILIRPSCYAFLSLIPILIYFQRTKLVSSTAALLFPILLCLGSASGINYMKHGFFSTQSFLGNNLYGKMLFVVRLGSQGHTPLQEKMIEYMLKRQKPFGKTFRKISMDHPLTFSMISPLYDKFRFLMFDQAKDAIPELKELPAQEIDGFCRDLSLAIMRQNPTGYIDDVSLNYRALWFTWELRVKEKREELKKFIDEFKDLPHFKEIGLDYDYVKLRNYPNVMVYAAQLFFALSYILSLYFIVIFLLAPLRVRTNNQAGLIISIMIHAIFLLTALVQAGLARYAMVMWPHMMVMNLIFYTDLWSRLFKPKDS